MVDDLLPVVTTEALAELLKREDDLRPTEGTSWEFKREVSRAIPKTVCAFADTIGGILILGASEKNQRLCGFAGMATGHEWTTDVGNMIRDGVSPWPVWFPNEVACPGSPDRRVLVIKVPRSTRTPHMHTGTGQVYLRSSAGKNDPVTDQATLNRLLDQGRQEDEAVNQRQHALSKEWPASLSTDGLQWFATVISTPLPFGAHHQGRLLTRAGYEAAARVFDGSYTQWLPLLEPGGMREDGVWLQLSIDNTLARAVIFEDGTILLQVLAHDPRAYRSVLHNLVLDVLAAQQRLLRQAIVEARLSMVWRSMPDVTLLDRARHGDQAVHTPSEWRGTTNVALLSEEHRARGADNLLRRLWRASGGLDFDPE